ncbi:hypothetical protein STXM2123_486 [Streptomyces sp. F-3]|nr:hypothetical protein STXM2123_486 [Streptomyces sp. F-3]
MGDLLRGGGPGERAAAGFTLRDSSAAVSRANADRSPRFGALPISHA